MKAFQPPTELQLKESQVRRLSRLTNIEADLLRARPVAKLADELQWRIDPQLLFFRRICGQVVKKDPVTGENHPVPFATVHVEDTDCNLLAFFPVETPWTWFLPLNCTREVIATVTTDACGRFCVWIPRFEIDWILRWRRERHCYPIIFERPRIRDLIPELLPDPPIMRPPRPQPDPPPFLLRDNPIDVQRAEDLLGRETTEKLLRLEASAELGAPTTQRQQVLDERVYPAMVPPPNPQLLLSHFRQADTRKMFAAHKVDVANIPDLDAIRFIGPFFRCHDVFVPEIVPIFDVPDITFRVTQDVDGDGDQEVIYAENFFDVRWNSGPIPDVTLFASEIALTGVACDTPEIPCEQPVILRAGLFPLANPAAPADPYYDVATGYARRPNRPHASGRIVPQLSDLPLPLSTAPFAGTLQLYGCNHLDGASFYRLMYRFRENTAVPFSAPVPFSNTWKVFRLVGGTLQMLTVTPDPSGWYNILPEADGWAPDHLLMNWPTGTAGIYEIELQLGNAAKAVIHTAPAIRIRVDNANPNVLFTKLEWRRAGDLSWTVLPLTCPVVRRPAGQTIEFRVSFEAWAGHFRSVRLTAGGCGGGNPVLTTAPASAEHWYTNNADNYFSNAGSPAVYSLAGGTPAGSYGFHLWSVTRAFNPAGGDGGFEADWNYNPTYRERHSSLSVAVVDE